MERFEKAQEFFGSFQKNGEFPSLRKSLDILDELMGIQGRESERAAKLKENIGHYIDSQVEGIYRKANLREFSKGLDDDECVELLVKSVSQEDLIKYVKFLRIQADYFGQEIPRNLPTPSTSRPSLSLTLLMRGTIPLVSQFTTVISLTPSLPASEACEMPCSIRHFLIRSPRVPGFFR